MLKQKNQQQKKNSHICYIGRARYYKGNTIHVQVTWELPHTKLFHTSIMVPASHLNFKTHFHIFFTNQATQKEISEVTPHYMFNSEIKHIRDVKKQAALVPTKSKIDMTVDARGC